MRLELRITFFGSPTDHGRHDPAHGDVLGEGALAQNELNPREQAVGTFQLGLKPFFLGFLKLNNTS